MKVYKILNIVTASYVKEMCLSSLLEFAGWEEADEIDYLDVQFSEYADAKAWLYANKNRIDYVVVEVIIKD